MRRFLIVANQTLGGQQLLDEIRRRADEGPCDVYVVVPATQPLDYVLGAGAMYSGVLGAEGLVVPIEPVPDEEGRRRAAAHLEEALDRLSGIGLDPDGEIGDPDPLEAVHDVLQRRSVDELIVSTFPPGWSRWLRMDLVNRMKRRFDLPVDHVFVDEPAAPS